MVGPHPDGTRKARQPLEAKQVCNLFCESDERIDLGSVPLFEFLLDGEIDRCVVAVAMSVQAPNMKLTRDHTHVQILHILQIEVGNEQSNRLHGLAKRGAIQFGNDGICDIEYCRQGYDSSVVMSLVWMRSLRRKGSL